MIDLLLISPSIFFISAIGLILAITIHEFSHAFVANRLGDPTARSLGRVSLNPLVHLDPIGTAMLVIAGFGWGKPVPFDAFNLSHPRRDAALISLAGPASNLAMAVVLTLISQNLFQGIFFSKFIFLIAINISLAVFNLVPVHPLDGAKIITGLLPRDLAYEWENISNRYGSLILIALILPIGGSSLISSITSPIINLILSLLIK